jgi:hypothetical protein
VRGRRRLCTGWRWVLDRRAPPPSDARSAACLTCWLARPAALTRTLVHLPPPPRRRRAQEEAAEAEREIGERFRAQVGLIRETMLTVDCDHPTFAAIACPVMMS